MLWLAAERGPEPSSSLAICVRALVTHSPRVSRRREAALAALARASRETPLTDQGDGALARCGRPGVFAGRAPESLLLGRSAPIWFSLITLPK
jgi:hypothetical protein